MELDVKSLTDLFDDRVVDLALIDNCELGTHFLQRRNSVNNILSKKTKASRKAVEESLLFLQQYPQIRVTSDILAELKEKTRILSIYARRFEHNSRQKFNGRNRRAHHLRKERNILQEIVEREGTIIRVLQQRVLATDDKEIRPYVHLVMAAQLSLTVPPELKNYNDEKMVATALALAEKEDRYVAILTEDTRIPFVVRRTQWALTTYHLPDLLRKTGQPRATVSFDRLKQRLEEGKVMVIMADEEVPRYSVRYSSNEFYEGRKPNHPPVIITPAMK